MLSTHEAEQYLLVGSGDVLCSRHCDVPPRLPQSSEWWLFRDHSCLPSAKHCSGSCVSRKSPHSSALHCPPGLKEGPFCSVTYAPPLPTNSPHLCFASSQALPSFSLPDRFPFTRFPQRPPSLSPASGGPYLRFPGCSVFGSSTIF